MTTTMSVVPQTIAVATTVIRGRFVSGATVTLAATQLALQLRAPRIAAA